MTVTPSSPVLPLRCLDLRQSARYWDVSTGSFRELIWLEPASLKLPQIDCNIYDRQAIDAAMSAMRLGGL